jgi:PAB-dependent poly(A)-specific ribonuclease subunit 3
LPERIEHFHSLVPLDTAQQNSQTPFGYPSWVYKAISVNDGKAYALRRFEGYRLTSERAVRNIQAWKRIVSGSIVTIHDVFTTRAFGDSSLIFVTDYHPLSTTLAQHHFGAGSHFQPRQTGQISEKVLWSYIVQIASALKIIHNTGLAVRLIEPSKILLTSKNRIRLNACGVLDVIQFDSQTSIAELQQDDLMQLGRLVLSLAVNNIQAMHNPTRFIEHLSRIHSPELRECILWLLNSPTPQNFKGIDSFLANISGHVITSFNSVLHSEDNMTTMLSRELENGRLVRLLVKLGFIADRPEFDHDPQWSESGDRYFLKLFRDHVFHAVDANGNPVLDLGHVLTCLNKLDVGIDERLQLESADEQTLLFVSYRELKRRLQDVFQELVVASQRSYG